VEHRLAAVGDDDALRRDREVGRVPASVDLGARRGQRGIAERDLQVAEVDPAVDREAEVATVQALDLELPVVVVRGRDPAGLVLADRAPDVGRGRPQRGEDRALISGMLVSSTPSDRVM
jgi:hypothetical protein